MNSNFEQNADNKEKKKNKKALLIILIALLLVFTVSLAVIIVPRFIGDGFDSTQYKDNDASLPPIITEPADESEPIVLVENPIKFDELRETNGDVCAWITVPNTKIDYPILQSSKEDDNYYINHSWDNKYTINGAIYIQRLNGNTFNDRNTVIYGHNLRNGTMFRNLHEFKNKEFFDKNEYFYIYTPGHILTYRIFSAYRYDNRHILNSFDFADTDAYAEYLEMAQNPNSMIKNVREVELTTDDRIVTLSTCISDKRYRYLVQGVLISDQLTY